jgi:hypothetical protein
MASQDSLSVEPVEGGVGGGLDSLFTLVLENIKSAELQVAS